jgi:hypothetical protein
VPGQPAGRPWTGVPARPPATAANRRRPAGRLGGQVSAVPLARLGPVAGHPAGRPGSAGAYGAAGAADRPPPNRCDPGRVAGWVTAGAAGWVASRGASGGGLVGRGVGGGGRADGFGVGHGTGSRTVERQMGSRAGTCRRGASRLASFRRCARCGSGRCQRPYRLPVTGPPDGRPLRDSAAAGPELARVRAPGMVRHPLTAISGPCLPRPKRLFSADLIEATGGKAGGAESGVLAARGRDMRSARVR